MRKFNLTIITENQNSLLKAQKLSGIIAEVLGLVAKAEITKYSKFSDAYKIILSFTPEQSENMIFEAVEKSDRLMSPWLITYYREEGGIELIFNKDERSSFRKQEFNVISWACLEID